MLYMDYATGARRIYIAWIHKSIKYTLKYCSTFVNEKKKHQEKKSEICALLSLL